MGTAPQDGPFHETDALVTAIHATPQRMVIAFAGAGAQALARLHAVGGSSRTVLEAMDLYAVSALREWVGFAPQHVTSRRVAAAMAEAAWRRARRLTAGDPAPAPVFGLGVTAAIATDRPKKGQHRVLVAVRDGLGTASYALTFEKGARDRAGEEAVVTQLVLRAVADACGVLAAPGPELRAGEQVEADLDPAAMLSEFGAGERAFVVVREDGALVRALPGSVRAVPPVILSGAFNPVHAGHFELAAAAARQASATGTAETPRPVFELPLLNADKSPIDLFEGRRRALQFAGRAPVALTHQPLFAGKAGLFPGSVFVIGADTAERIVEPRFYDQDPAQVEAALRAIAERRCRFLVAARKVGGRLVRLADVALPEGFQDLFEPIPEDAFRRDVSSTQIRERWGSEP